MTTDYVHPGMAPSAREARATGGDASRVGQAAVRIIVDPRMFAAVEFEATYVNVPSTGALLVWSAPDMGHVDCSVSNGRRALVIRRRSGVVVSIGASGRGEEVRVRVHYSYRLPRLAKTSSEVYVVEAEHLPALRSRNPFAIDTPSSPLNHASHTVVEVDSENSDWQSLGPQYVMQAQRAGRFSYLEGKTPFSVITGRLGESDAVVDGVPLLFASSVRRNQDAISHIARSAAAIRAHFLALFGPPAVVHSAVVVYNDPTSSSSSLGSAILLNTARIGPKTEEQGIKAHLVRTLAHEYAHTWWSYSPVWSDHNVADIAIEMLAVTLSNDYLLASRVPLGLRVVRDNLWAYMAQSVGLTDAELRLRASAVSGSYSAALLIALIQQDRLSVIGPLQELWRIAQRSCLTLEDFQRVFGAPIGEALIEALLRPRPATVSTRVCYDAHTGWHIGLRARLSDYDRLVTRLGFFHRDLRSPGKRVELRIAVSGGASDVISALHTLEPWHVVLRRSKRLLLIHGHPILKRMWLWATSPARGDETSNQGSGQSLGLVRPLVALLLNAEDPHGWRGVAAMVRRIFPGLAKSLERQAASRAGFYGEVQLLKPLEP
jgi:hypothetical protein